MTDLPAPPISSDVDLTDFPFMPLNVRQLRDSRFAATADAEAFRCGVLLWCAAWHQVPAGSLPSDDIELAQLAGFGRSTKEWKRVRVGALYGWREHSDGRLYHPVVVKAALEAWDRRGDWQEQRRNDEDRKTRYRERLKQLSEELRELGVRIPRNRSLDALEQLLAETKQSSTARTVSGDVAGTLRGRCGDSVDVARMAMTGTGTGTGTGTHEEAGTRGRIADQTRPVIDPPSDLLEQLQDGYPDGTYRQSEWLIGHREALRRLEEGATVLELLQGRDRYRIQCDAKGSTGTQFVMSPARFFARTKEGGPAPYTDPFPLPKTGAEVRQDENVNAGLEWLRESGASQ